MRLRWGGGSCVLWGAGIGLVLGVAEALLANWRSATSSYEQAKVFYSQFGIFGPFLGGIIGCIIFKLRELRKQNRRAAGRCSGCGYDLTGNKTGVCPECATRLE